MALPKGFRKNIKITNQKVGPERRQELLDDIANQGTFLPRGVGYEDMDKTFIEMVTKDMDIVIDGKKVPVIFLTIQKWSEFSKAWQNMDEFKNIKIPFITIVRRPDVQVGTNQAGNWNIPGNRGYTYMKVPTYEGGRRGVDVYKIPQPTSVDITYEVRLFCNRMAHINAFNEILQRLFQSRQHYIYVLGHPMPVVMESINDESKTDDFDKRRFYVQMVETKLIGYILDENDFEVIPSVNRLRVSEKLSDSGKSKRRSSSVTYTLNFEDGSVDTFTVTAEFDTNFTQITNQVNIASIDITVDGNPVTLPLNVVNGTVIEFTITRVDSNEDSSFVLNGIK